MRTPAHKSMLRLGAALALVALGGCATMSRDECLTVDWRTVGFEDGVAGYSGDRIGQHRKACAEYGVTPDLTAYQSGRQEGLREYCVPANGFRVGSSGGGYAGICPAELEPAFEDAYQAGHQLYTLESRVSSVAYALDQTRGDLRDAESDIVTRSAVAISGEATTEERAQAILDVKHLGERVGKLKSEIRQLEEDRVNSERDLEDYRATLQYNR